MQDETEAVNRPKSSARALASGAAGAVLLTGLHEMARRVIPHAPRMDVIGERALLRTLTAIGTRPHGGQRWYRETLAGELLSNTLYYSVVAAGSRSGALWRGALLGLAAGIGAVLLPPRLGLGRPPGEKAPLTPLLTVAWYTAGGLAAGAVARLSRWSNH